MKKKPNIGVFKKLAVIFIGMILIFSLTACNVTMPKSMSINGGGGASAIASYNEYYNVVKQALYDYDTTLSINVKNYDKNVYNIEVVKKIIDENPNLAGNNLKYKLSIKQSLTNAQLTFTFEYAESKEVLADREAKVKAKINDIVGKIIKSNMKDYEKEIAIHDYLVQNCKYDERYFTGNMPLESYSAYGALIKGVAVCEGYAIAMDRLLKASGVEDILITGEADNGKGDIPHAWNLVKLGGQYYHLDTTWDDPMGDSKINNISYTYFNLTDAEIQKNHKWNKENYAICNSKEYSFDNLNIVEKDSSGNSIIKVQSYNEFSKAIATQISKKTKSVTYKFINFDGKEENIKNAITTAYKTLNKGGKYGFSFYKEEIGNNGYITVEAN